MSKRKPDDIRIPLTSANVVDERLERLRDLFPEAFREGKVDFARLRSALGDVVDEERERYGLSWAGKSEAIRAIQIPSIGTLKPVPEESIDFDTTGNLFIEGDNLEVLKLLQNAYHGRIKMIYIDPPYNTGQEFVYTDNFRDGLGEYLRCTGQVDDEGISQTTSLEAEGRFHSRWLNMMFPRLYLARNLLAEDGVIFISIDDHECKNLRALCDEIFGEEQFIAQFIWKSRQQKDNRTVTGASIDHEYVLCYGRKVRGEERDISQYSNPDNDPRGPWTSGNMVGLATEDRRRNLHYDLINPDTGINYGRPRLGWRYDRNTMRDLIEDGRILWPASQDGRPRKKSFLNELKGQYTGFSSIVGGGVYTKHGTEEVESLFGGRAMDFPKPVALLKELLLQGSNDDCMILDFFAGSGSLGQAIYELNRETQSNRRFILVQLPEPAQTKSEARALGYHSIAEVAKDRLRRVVRRLGEKKSDELALGSSTAFDEGFRVFKLAPSNFRIWHADDAPSVADELAKQLELYAENVLPGHSRQEILYELVLKAGFPLDVPIEERLVGKSPVYWIDGGALAICLEDRVTRELLAGIMELKPSRVLCLDHAFGENDQLKTNAVLEMKSHGMVFQTV